ncbi:MAG: permease-like cell division protein FtsX [Crocinitomicaceae bacterium]|jgi:cell division transport system permease protein|nr:permease-like cell division protein FtsX [Crocinitomicaceae bacterium]MDP5010773.1 permease-like cell division protein FtsX [Crocinitomicaceae bacterium]
MSSSVEKYSKRGVRSSYISTVIGISLVLFMIGLVLGGVFGLDNVQKKAKESLQGDLFFKAELNEADIKQIEQELKTWNEFSDVTFVSPDRAIEEFSGTNGNKEDILSIFEGENPLPSTISFKPKADFATKDGMEKIKAKLLSSYPEQIDEVNYDQSSVESVNLGFKQFVFLFLAVALLLIIVAVAMINNTIRLALYSKRFTIKTMQLVGAKPSYIRRPFLMQSILQGAVSALIGIALLMTLFYALNNMLNSFEISYSLETFLLLVVSLMGIGIIITFISTWFALNKYLRMKLDDLY